MWIYRLPAPPPVRRRFIPPLLRAPDAALGGAACGVDVATGTATAAASAVVLAVAACAVTVETGSATLAVGGTATIQAPACAIDVGVAVAAVAGPPVEPLPPVSGGGGGGALGRRFVHSPVLAPRKDREPEPIPPPQFLVARACVVLVATPEATISQGPAPWELDDEDLVALLPQLYAMLVEV